MKVLSVGVFSPDSTNTFQAKALAAIGHDVVPYEYRGRLSALGSGPNRDTDLIDTCKSVRPDVIIFSKCNGVDARVVTECGKVGRTVLWYMDALNNFDNELIEKMKAAHSVCYAHPGLGPYIETHNSNHTAVEEGYDSTVHHPLPDVAQDIDVSFIGSLYGHRGEFASLFQHFTGVYNDKHAHIVARSRINLNFTSGLGPSDRLYKILGSRGFLLTESWEGMTDQFEAGKDFVVFNGYGDLENKIKMYLGDEEKRQSIANSGYTTVQQFSCNEWARNVIASTS